MKAIWLIGQKVVNFLLICFGSSLLLAAFVWVAPGSPGRPRLNMDWDSVVLNETRACIDAKTCGVVAGLPPAPYEAAQLLVDGDPEARSVREDFLKYPGPTFAPWFFGTLWGGLLTGDLLTEAGDSATGRMTQAAKITIPLVFGALFGAILLAGVVVAFLTWLPFPALRGVIRAALLVVSIAPVFVLGYLLQKQGIVPHAMTWPVLIAAGTVLAIGDGSLGEIVLQFENEVRLLRSQDYVHAARLRGASPLRHMLPGLLLPASAISAGKIAFLLGSVVIVEQHWVLAGLGDASLLAAKDPADPVLLLAVTLVVTAVVALVALLRDVLEILIDPRLRRSSSEAP
jgi:ABC-type dipeptide/oligopeptide/nickel transport system permease component